MRFWSLDHPAPFAAPPSAPKQAQSQGGGTQSMPDIGKPDRFDGIWWTAQIPSGWSARGEDKCATFQSNASPGILQISSALKETGPITDSDLREFAVEEIRPGEQLVSVKYNALSGFYAAFEKDNLLWQEWWLRAGNLMIYATYNLTAQWQGDAITEQQRVKGILESLEPKVQSKSL